MDIPETHVFGIDRVILTVRDLDRVAEFYRKKIGLHVQGEEGSVLHLGNGSETLLELRHDPQARPQSRREAGLFHTAFLLPSRAALGSWVRHAYESQVPITGAADHFVSEAVYLDDPEGNGVEVYADRPREQWAWNNGLVHMTTEPLNFIAVVESSAGVRWEGFPPGSTVGHVHLQVGSLPEAEVFYSNVLGLDITCRYPGAIFYSSEGYHHHIATNTWNSRGSQPRAEETAGLSEVALSMGGSLALDRVRDRAASAGIRIEERGNGISSRDPWNTLFSLRA